MQESLIVMSIDDYTEIEILIFKLTYINDLLFNWPSTRAGSINEASKVCVFQTKLSSNVYPARKEHANFTGFFAFSRY